MIDRIKNKIKQFEYRIYTSHQLQEDHLALTQLLKMFGDQTFLPLTSWSVSPREVLHICNDVVINKRKSIIEFGAGFSTICIAQLLKINNISASFVTVENHQEWANDMLNLLTRLGLRDYVKIIVAPITGVSSDIAKTGQQKWYNTRIISEHTKGIPTFDIVIVDGPFGGTTPFARYSAVPFLKSKLAADYAIFLDDSSRDEEKQIAADWLKLIGGKSKNHKRYVCLTSSSGFDVSPYGIKYKI
ncbi:MAG TPA: hypothetical protein VF676_09065 [Flavobacterium sp.]|jgi:hypothetical protein